MKKYLILCAIFIASCAQDNTTRPTECNLGNNRFALNEGDEINWSVRNHLGPFNSGVAKFRGCFTKFGGLTIADENYYDPLFRQGDTAVNFMGVEFMVTFDHLDSLVMRQDYPGGFEIVKFVKQ